MAVRSGDDRQVCLRLLQRLASARRAIIGIYFLPIPWPMTTSGGCLYITFGRLGAFLHLALFHAWSDAICGKERPQIEFPVDCLVGRYALPVVYYVAGWTLYSMSKASTIAEDKRALYFMFAASHTCNERATLDLPTSLVEKRKRRASVYCSREYFGFICLIENIFLANLTLKMMLAYNDGNIVAKIKESILSHDGMKDRFSSLVGT